MSFEPTPSQALLLFGLLARHGECPQAELIPAVKKADREALVKGKLVAAGKVGRGLYLRLEDTGWAWASDHLAADLPPAQRALSDVLMRLGEHLKKTGETLAGFIGSKPASVAAQKPPISKKSATTTKPATTKQATKARVSGPKQPTEAAVRKRIEKAYLKITGGRKNHNVKLSLLRRELADLDRKTVDAALTRILKGDEKVFLSRDDNTRLLDQSDHDAAFSPAGEPFHQIWISS